MSLGVNLLTTINRLLPKNPKKIVLYANLGFRDNVQALYNHLIREGYHKRYHLICVSDNFYDLDRVDGVHYCGLYQGVYHFLTAGYFFYCFGKYPIKPAPNQEVVNLWHGMPLKKIGNLEEHLKDKDFNFFTKLLVTSPFFEPIMRQAFKAQPQQMLIAGNPRCDDLFSPLEELATPEMKQVLWLPTYRQGLQQASPVQQLGLLFGLTASDWLILDAQLYDLGIKLYIKLHPLEESAFQLPSACRRISLINDAQLSQKKWSFYRFLGSMDALLTDYSSVFLDYLLLDRPMGFVLDDLETYRQQRGFIFDDIEEFFVGDRIYSQSDLYQFFERLALGEDYYMLERQSLNVKVNVVQDNICQKLLEDLNLFP